MNDPTTAAPFTPTERHLRLLERTVGGDARHKNHRAVHRDGSDAAAYRELVAAGLAEESPTALAKGWKPAHPHSKAEDFTWFQLTPAGLALVDGRREAPVRSASEGENMSEGEVKKEECPFWADGRHAFEVAWTGDSIAQEMELTELVKRCRCGAVVRRTGAKGNRPNDYNGPGKEARAKGEAPP